jgi:hypothetical protein
MVYFLGTLDFSGVFGVDHQHHAEITIAHMA